MPANVELVSGDFIIGKIYKSEIDNSVFRLTKYKFKDWRDFDEFEWNLRVRLELIDSFGETEYEFEYDNSLNDLYDIVREQISNVSTIVDNILGLNTTSIQYLSWGGSKWEASLNDLNCKWGNNLLTSISNPQFEHQAAGSSSSHKSKNINYCSETGEEYTAVCIVHASQQGPITFLFRYNKNGDSNVVESPSIKYLDWDRNIQEVTISPIKIIEPNKEPVISFVSKRL